MEALVCKTNLVCSDTTFISLSKQYLCCEKKTLEEKFYPPTCYPKIPFISTATLQTSPSTNQCCVPIDSGK